MAHPPPLAPILTLMIGHSSPSMTGTSDFDPAAHEGVNRPDSKAVFASQSRDCVRIGIRLSRLDPTGFVPDDSIVYVDIDRDGTLHPYKGTYGIPGSSLPLRFLSARLGDYARVAGRYGPPMPLLSTVIATHYPWECADGGEFLGIREPAAPRAARYADLEARRTPAEIKYPRNAPNIRLARMVRIASSLHNAVWRRALPLLDARALRQARAVGGDLAFYNLLVQCSRLQQLIEVAPLAGIMARLVFLSGVRSADEFEELCLAHRMPLKDALRNLYNAIRAGERSPAARIRRAIEGPSPFRCDNRGMVAQVSPGFVALARAARANPLFFPFRAHFQVAEQLGHLVHNQVHLDPNRMRALRDPSDWRFLHYVLAAKPSTEILQAVLRDVRAARMATLRYFPPAESRVRLADQTAALLSDIRDTVKAYMGGSTRGYSFVRLSEICKEYHKELRRDNHQRAIIAAEESNVAFPQPAFTQAQIGPLRLEWLPDSKGLAQEGEVLSHCVGGYTEACSSGRSIIYAVRSAEGEPVATLEVDRSYSVVQLRGRNDSVPPRSLFTAVKRMVEQGLGRGEAQEAVSDFGALSADLRRFQSRDLNDPLRRHLNVDSRSKDPDKVALDFQEHGRYCFDVRPDTLGAVLVPRAYDDYQPPVIDDDAELPF